MDKKKLLLPITTKLAKLTAVITLYDNFKNEFNKKIETYDRRFQGKFCSYFVVISLCCYIT